MKPAAYRRYLLTALVVIYAFNFMEVSAFGMALQSIKVSLHLSDAQLGVFGGLAVSLFYSTAGLALGRWTDVGNRVTILTVTRILWGVMLVLTGKARSFVQICAIRMGVAVGESGCLPPAYSFIGDYFSREERPRALGILWLGIPCAYILGYFATGWMIERFGWRRMFTIIGATGFVLALVAWSTLKEPRTEQHEKKGGSKRLTVPGTRDVGSGEALAPSLWETLKSLYANVTYKNVVWAFVVAYFFNVGAVQWQAPFFIRSYGMTTETLGAWLAVVFGVSGILGNYLGGVVTTGRDERVQLITFAGVQVCVSILTPLVYLTRNLYVSFLMLGLSSLFSNLGNAPATASLQAVVSSRVRAVSISVLYLFANLVGLAIAPVMTGALSDALRPALGAESLRYALILMSPWFFLGAWFAWRASKTVAHDVEAARAEDEGAGSGTPALGSLSG